MSNQKIKEALELGLSIAQWSHHKQLFIDAKDQLSKERERSEGLMGALKGLLDPENDGDESYMVAYEALAKYQEEGE
jgi:hypothetical protein